MRLFRVRTVARFALKWRPVAGSFSIILCLIRAAEVNVGCHNVMARQVKLLSGPRLGAAGSSAKTSCLPGPSFVDRSRRQSSQANIPQRPTYRLLASLSWMRATTFQMTLKPNSACLESRSVELFLKTPPPCPGLLL